MRNKTCALHIQTIVGFLLIILFVVVGDIQNARGQAVQSVEGVWEVVSVSDNSLINFVRLPQRVSITRINNGYEVLWQGSDGPMSASGSDTYISSTVNPTLTTSFRLAGDGNSLQWAWNGVYKATLKNISRPVKEAVRGEKACQANCGPTDPNRTTPITTDLCPGNLVAMTYFCGGGTGCPYVCCPKGLPYLNHCDCKCYATSDFDCHSYSHCQEQPKQ